MKRFLLACFLALVAPCLASAQNPPTVAVSTSPAVITTSPAGATVQTVTITVTVTSTPPPVTHHMDLTWVASPTPGVTYSILRGGSSGTELATPIASKVSGLAFSDTSVGAGATYCYEVLAVDALGNASGASNETCKTIPTP